jgi:hypothetical protein
MPTNWTAISSHIKSDSEASIFLLNVYLQAVVLGLPRQLHRELIQDMLSGFKEPKFQKEWLSIGDRTELAKNLLLSCASNTKFQLNSYENVPEFDCGKEATLVTVTTAQVLLRNYLSGIPFYSSSSSAFSSDRLAFEDYLQRTWSKSGEQFFLEDNLLSEAIQELAKKEVLSKRQLAMRSKYPFFWVRPASIDTSSLTASEVRDVLGLIHIEDSQDWLVEIQISTSAAIPTWANLKATSNKIGLVRPRAIGAFPGRRFRGVTLDEAHNTIKPLAHGTTIDLDKLASGTHEIDGWPELLCTQLPWGSADTVEMAQWWKEFQPKVRVLGKLTAGPRGLSMSDSDLAYENRLRSDFSSLGLKIKLP